jgi:hypothetical protein
MASSNEGKRSKVNGDSWGEQGADGEAPVVLGAEQALGGKEQPLRRPNSQAIVRGSAGAHNCVSTRA